MRPVERFAASLLAAGLLFAFEGPATAAADRERTVEQLIEVSGTRQMIERFMVVVGEQMVLYASQLEGGQGDALRESFDAVFAPEPIRKAVAEALLEQHDPERAQETLAWFESDFGRRIRAEEAVAQDPAKQEPFIEFIVASQSEAPNPDRLDIAVRIDRGRQASSVALRLTTEFLRSIMGATAAVAAGDGPPPTPVEIEAAVEEQVAPLAPSLQNQMVVTYLYIGRNLSLADNRRYLAHIESDAGRWFYTELGNALVGAMSRAGQAFGIHIAALVEARRGEAAEPSEAQRTTAITEARSFAGSRKPGDCIDEIYARRNACKENACFAISKSFAQTCFEAALADASLCSGVPRPADAAASIYWRGDRCAARGTSDSACSATLLALQEHCEVVRSRR